MKINSTDCPSSLKKQNRIIELLMIDYNQKILLFLQYFVLGIIQINFIRVKGQCFKEVFQSLRMGSLNQKFYKSVRCFLN